MKTTESASLNLSALQNPFRLARLRSELSAVSSVESISRDDWQDSTREFARKAVSSDLGRDMRMLSIALTAERETEAHKPVAVRAWGQTSGGQDDAWRIWAVLNREVSAALTAQAAEEGGEFAGFTALECLCADLWTAWGFDASLTEQSDYSPTGRMFSRGLYVRVARNGCIILSQSGARDV